MERGNLQADRSERTRASLVKAGRELFGELGYPSVSVEDVARRAGVTKGALYHQFPGGKGELFAQVVEAVEQEFMETVAATVGTGGADPIDALRRGADAALDASLDPAVSRITLVDAPAVLGWQAWRDLGDRYALGLVRTVLAAAAEAGLIRPGSQETLAHLVLAAVEEAGLVVARAEDPKAARREAGEALAQLLEGLRT